MSGFREFPVTTLVPVTALVLYNLLIATDKKKHFLLICQVFKNVDHILIFGKLQVSIVAQMKTESLPRQASVHNPI